MVDKTELTFSKRLGIVELAVGSALPYDYAKLLENGVPKFDAPTVVPFRGDVWDLVDFFELGDGPEYVSWTRSADLCLMYCPNSRSRSRLIMLAISSAFLSTVQTLAKLFGGITNGTMGTTTRKSFLSL